MYTAESTGASMERTNMPTLRNGNKGDSNPGALDCESGILPLSYRDPRIVTIHSEQALTNNDMPSINIKQESSYSHGRPAENTQGQIVQNPNEQKMCTINDLAYSQLIFFRNIDLHKVSAEYLQHI